MHSIETRPHLTSWAVVATAPWPGQIYVVSSNISLCVNELIMLAHLTNSDSRTHARKGGNNCWLLHAILLAAVTLATLQGWE
jgi:hypothetical protein